jgi:hypothetical protein
MLKKIHIKKNDHYLFFSGSIVFHINYGSITYFFEYIIINFFIYVCNFIKVVKQNIYVYFIIIIYNIKNPYIFFFSQGIDFNNFKSITIINKIKSFMMSKND